MSLGIGNLIDNRYELTDVIGQGQTTAVFKARNKDHRRDVAVKVLNVRDGDHLEAKRFQQQARLNARILHPNVVQVFDYGIADSGEPYIVYDLLNGTTLQALIEKDGSQTAEKALSWTQQILEALEIIHNQKIVMRDLKPSNIFLAKYEHDREKPVLIDFRIAFLADNPDSQLTQMGEIVGTPTFISPEACLGQIATCQSDLYSLGCTLYFMLLGEPPFWGKSMIDTMQMHTSQPPPSPSAKKPELKFLDHIVARALDKDPNSRYKNAQEMRLAIKSLGL